MSNEQGTAQERFWSYRSGWGRGAQGKRADPKFAEHPSRPDLSDAYSRGYEDGVLARANALSAEADRLGYDRQAAILRERDGR